MFFTKQETKLAEYFVNCVLFDVSIDLTCNHAMYVYCSYVLWRTRPTVLEISGRVVHERALRAVLVAIMSMDLNSNAYLQACIKLM